MFLNLRRSVLIFLAWATILLSAILSACNSPPLLATPLPQSPGLVNTLAVQTISAFEAARLTEIAQFATPKKLISPSLPTVSPTLPSTAGATITSSPIATPTQAFIPSLTPLVTTALPTHTPDPTLLAAIASGEVSPCIAADLYEDVTIPDGSQLPPSIPFTKIWRILNTGSCTWNTSYTFSFMSGERMEGNSVRLPKTVQPGEYVDIVVNMISPSIPGFHQGNWMLSDGSSFFGAGTASDKPFFVLIEVMPKQSRIKFNFAQSICTATWESSAGDLPCPGQEAEPSGFALLLLNPHLETRRENEPTLWTHPTMVEDGWIAGTYPPILIQTGYHFLAEIGCLDRYPNCDVLFELYVQIGDETETKLGVWKEISDKRLTRIDIDLSAWANKEVVFTLVVRANSNPHQAAAFWLQPQIRLP